MDGQALDDTRNPLAAFSRYSRAYFQRWILLGALIGIAAGVSMIIFYTAIDLCTHWLLGVGAGLTPPSPAGEGSTAITAIGRRWMIPFITTIGGLLTGLIVYSLAPEAARGGTDASINTFHEKNGRMRSRVPLVKLAASAITIGSGGSAGREGAAAQIMAGFGSWLGRVLHLDDHDRRIALVAGIGSGVGTIFRAPFAGALFATEVLYKRDVEADALFPTFIASVVGYAIYGAVEGWTPIFGSSARFHFADPRSLLGFAILGICAGGVGLLFQQAMKRTHTFFDWLRLPLILKPALGGLIVGLIGLFLPEALSMGYGYVQLAISDNFVHLSGVLLAVLVFAKIATTALTIGSGGSGGDVAPAMVVGGFLGGALWAGLHTIAPELVMGIEPGAFVIVGMAAFFGGISKTPLAMILMVVEMTGELALIVPAMLATMIASVATGETSVYERQVPTRLDSPAHKNDYALPLLQSLAVRDAMTSGLAGALATASPETSLDELSRLMRERRVTSIPVVKNGRLVGMVTATDLARVPPAEATLSRAHQIMSRVVLRAYPDESLYAAWLRMSRRGLRQLAVVDRSDPSRLLGMLTADNIGRILRPSVPHPSASSGSTRLPGVGALAQPVAAAVNGEADQEDDELDTGLAEEVVPVSSGTSAISAASSGHSTPIAPTSGVADASGADPLALARVADAMLTTPRLIGESEPITVARQLIDERGAALMVVDSDGRLVGIVTRSDLRGRADREDGRQVVVSDVAVRNLVTASPNETLRTAVRRMNRLGLRQLPVVAGEPPTPPLGLLRRSDVLAAYERYLAGEAASLQTVRPSTS